LWCCQSDDRSENNLAKFGYKLDSMETSFYILGYLLELIHKTRGNLGKKTAFHFSKRPLHLLSFFLPSFSLCVCVCVERSGNKNRLREPAFPCVSRLPNQRGASVLMAV